MAATGKAPVLDLHPVGLRGIDYPGLIWTLIRTDFKSRYHGTLMGFLWALMKPAAMFLVLMGVFSLIFASDPHYSINLLIGLLLWDFFNESTKVGLTSLANRSYLLDKTRFPRWILIVCPSPTPCSPWPWSPRCCWWRSWRPGASLPRPAWRCSCWSSSSSC